MKRRRLIAAAAAMAALSACGARRSSLRLPGRIDGGWELKSEAPLDAGAIPGEVRRLGLKQASQASYDGPVPISVKVYQMTTDAGAFEAGQKWRPAEGALAFHAGACFVVAESPGAGHDTLNRFAAAMEKALALK